MREGRRFSRKAPAEAVEAEPKLSREKLTNPGLERKQSRPRHQRAHVLPNVVLVLQLCKRLGLLLRGAEPTGPVLPTLGFHHLPPEVHPVVNHPDLEPTRGEDPRLASRKVVGARLDGRLVLPPLGDGRSPAVALPEDVPRVVVVA